MTIMVELKTNSIVSIQLRPILIFKHAAMIESFGRMKKFSIGLLYFKSARGIL